MKKTKKCVVCKKLKPIDRYREGRNRCMDCRNAQVRKRPYRSGIGLRARMLWHNYKITEPDYQQMLLNQNGVCKICSEGPNGYWGILAVDHCHQTGKVRALLCDRCNRGLGQFKDNIEIMSKAVEYLKGHQ